jgi:MFS family permease
VQIQRFAVPAEIRSVFIRAAVAGFAGFAVLGLFTAVSPALLSQVIHVTNHVVTGAVVVTVFAASAVGQVLTASVAERAALLAGCLALAIGAVLVALGIAAASMPLLLTGAVLAGVGQGMSFRAGLSAVTIGAPSAQRSEVSSSFFLVAYVAISIPVIGVGAASEAFGLVPAGVTFAAIVAALAAIAFVALLVLPADSDPADAPSQPPTAQPRRGRLRS